MKVISINSCNYGSTGTIMHGIADCARKAGIEHYTSSPYSRSQKLTDVTFHLYIGSILSHNFHIQLAIMLGRHGLFSRIATKKYIKRVTIIKPDTIHLHNIHGDYIHLPLLFSYIKHNRIPVVWTLHDCWPFTGQCPHFTAVKCDRWKTGCCSCTQYKKYPASVFDNTKRMWRLKKEWFTGAENITIVAPSQWLADLVKQSYLKDYPVKVIHNGIDLSVFKPTPGNFREQYDIGDKHIVLGVAFGWGERKGLDVFVELSKRLSENYQIVLVGTNDKVDEQLPKNIISVHRTQNQTELAEIYTAADVFANPTREEVLGLVNIEALACGTPVITFNTGGSPECIDETCGVVVDCDDVDAMEREIIRVCSERLFSKEACIRRSQVFDKEERFKEYVGLYEKIADGISDNRGE